MLQHISIACNILDEPEVACTFVVVSCNEVYINVWLGQSLLTYNIVHFKATGWACFARLLYKCPISGLWTEANVSSYLNFHQNTALKSATYSCVLVQRTAYNAVY
jgi:hypothetical protein